MIEIQSRRQTLSSGFKRPGRVTGRYGLTASLRRTQPAGKGPELNTRSFSAPGHKRFPVSCAFDPRDVFGRRPTDDNTNDMLNPRFECINWSVEIHSIPRRFLETRKFPRSKKGETHKGGFGGRK